MAVAIVDCDDRSRGDGRGRRIAIGDVGPARSDDARVTGNDDVLLI
jgi:hypothetical protein